MNPHFQTEAGFHVAEEDLIRKDGVDADPVAMDASVARARRKLMLGAAAVLPSIVTLRSGATAAIASNTKCWTKIPDESPVRFSYAPDGWLRKQVYEGKYLGEPAFCVVWDQGTCRDPANPNKAAGGTTWLVNLDQATGGRFDEDFYFRQWRALEVDQMAKITHMSAGPQSYALVYVDQSGTVATLNPDPAQKLRPVRESCWTSMIGSRASFLG